MENPWQASMPTRAPHSVENCKVIIGGDFSVILDANLDGSGDKPQMKESCRKIEDLCSSFDLIYVWRVRNPDVKRFMRRQENSVVQRRLNLWLITRGIEEQVENVGSIPAIRTDKSKKQDGVHLFGNLIPVLEDRDYIKL